VVVLAAARPADAAIDAVYSGASRLLAKATFIAGNPADAPDLQRAGVTRARSVLVLTQSKASASADGADNLSDDTEGIMVAATVFKLAPLAHVFAGRVTEILFRFEVCASWNSSVSQLRQRCLRGRPSRREVARGAHCARWWWSRALAVARRALRTWRRWQRCRQRRRGSLGSEGTGARLPHSRCQRRERFRDSRLVARQRSLSGHGERCTRLERED
jgi:hypothetical protein